MWCKGQSWGVELQNVIIWYVVAKMYDEGHVDREIKSRVFVSSYI